MGIKFFGQYMLEKGLITRDGLIRAVDLQESQNIKFGEYASKRGFLTRDDLNRLLIKQRNMDMKFGDLAVEEGLLNEKQVQEILLLQKNDHLFLGDALVELGEITRETLENELEAFQKDQEAYAITEISFPDNIKEERTIFEASVDLTSKLLLRIADIKTKLGGYILHETGWELADISAYVNFYGDLDIRYIINLSDDKAKEIAVKISGEDIEDDDITIIQDSVKEFCNIVCGNVMAKMAKMGKQIEITPPTILSNKKMDKYTPPEGRYLLAFPLIVPTGKVEVGLMSISST